MNQATIRAVALTPTHDGDAAAVVELEFPGGGRSQVQVDGESMRHILASEDIETIVDLIGRPWSVLECRPLHFAGRS